MDSLLKDTLNATDIKGGAGAASRSLLLLLLGVLARRRTGRGRPVALLLRVLLLLVWLLLVLLLLRGRTLWRGLPSRGRLAVLLAGRSAWRRLVGLIRGHFRGKSFSVSFSVSLGKAGILNVLRTHFEDEVRDWRWWFGASLLTSRGVEPRFSAGPARRLRELDLRTAGRRQSSGSAEMSDLRSPPHRTETSLTSLSFANLF